MSMTLILGAGPTQAYVKIPDGHPVLEKLGRITNEWAHFEHELDGMIYLLIELGDGKSIRIITSQLMGSAPRFRVILTLAKHHNLGKTITEKIVSLKNRTFEVSEQRNRAIHDPWFIERRHKTLAQSREIGELKNYGMEKVDIKEIDKTLDLIAQRRKELATIKKDMEPWLLRRRELRNRPPPSSLSQEAP